jgi:hypothetical protein
MLVRACFCLCHTLPGSISLGPLQWPRA